LTGSEAKSLFHEICLVLGHPLRREILDFLFENSQSFAELRSACTVDNGELGYHLRRMKDLIDHDSRGDLYQLTERGRIVCGWLNQTYLDLESRLLDLKVTAKHNPIRYAQRLKQSDHVLLFYEDEAIRQAVVFSFLKAGLLKGLAAVYLISEKRRDREVKQMRRTCADIREFEERQALMIMSSEQWYLQRGKASANTIISNWLNLANEKMKEGYQGLQVVGEMNVFIENGKVSELLSYERKLERRLPQMFCAMCVYGPDRLFPEQAISLIEAHRHGIFHSIAVPLG